MLFISIKLQAGGEDNSTGARSHALGQISILHQDLWNAENNPAGLGFQDQFGGGISYESPFLMNQLAYKSAVLAYPISAGSFGLSLGQFGYSQYSENKIGLSYGQRLSNTFNLGVQLNYLSTQIAEGGYGSTSALSGTIGIMAKSNEEFTLAAVVVNPNRAKRSAYRDERYPTLIKLGVAYAFSEKVRLLSEVVKDIDFDASAKVGIEYQAIDILYLRIGYDSNPALSTFGFGLKFNDFKMDFASGFHSTLGFTPQISLSFTPQKN
jgi:hypothetical protein